MSNDEKSKNLKLFIYVRTLKIQLIIRNNRKTKQNRKIGTKRLFEAEHSNNIKTKKIDKLIKLKTEKSIRD